MCISGSLAIIFNINSSSALVLSVIPPAIYLGLCFKLKTDTQIIIAEVMSVIYAFLMLVVSMTIISELNVNRLCRHLCGNFSCTWRPTLSCFNLKIAPPIYFPSGSMVKDKTILTPSSIFIVSMAIIYIITAIMHPQEFLLLFHGFLYIICIPSSYLLLTIYSMVNMNNVSWGTRETKPAAGAAPPTTTKPQTPAQKGR